MFTDEIKSYADVKGTERVTVCAGPRHRSEERPLGFCVVTTFVKGASEYSYEEVREVAPFSGPVFREEELPSLESFDPRVLFAVEG